MTDRLEAPPTSKWLSNPTLVAIGLLVIAVCVRVYFFAIQGGMHHPDEVFQYLEPAHWRLTGSGWLPWEYDRGARNWLLPGIYGSWMALFRELGLQSVPLRNALWSLNIGLSLLLIPAGFRMGRTLLRSDTGGVYIALLFALFPIFGWFAPRTLSENFGMLTFAWAIAFWLDDTLRRRSPSAARAARATSTWWNQGLGRRLLIGLLLGAAVSFRYTSVILIPFVLLDYNFRSRFRDMFEVAIGVAIAFLVVGWLDYVTWGRFFHSFIEFVTYNLIEKGNENHGVMDGDFYWSQALSARLLAGLPVLVGLIVFSLNRCWRLALTAALFIVAHSLIGHKEERFLLPIWPLLIAAAGCGAWQIGEWLRRRTDNAYVPSLTVTALTAALLAPSYVGVLRADMDHLDDLMRAQHWVGEQEDVTALVVDGPQWLDGGYFYFGGDVPQSAIRMELVGHELYNYVIEYANDFTELLAADGYEKVKTFGDAAIFRLAE